MGAAGSLKMRMPLRRISMPWGAFSDSATIPVTSAVAASFTSLRSKPDKPFSYTHCTRPPRFLSITKATVPMSRIVWTAPFTFTVCPFTSSLSRSASSKVSDFFTPFTSSIVFSPFRCCIPGKTKRPGILKYPGTEIIKIKSAVPPALNPHPSDQGSPLCM